MHERMTAVLQGCKPDRHPFVTRLEAWYKSHQRSGTLPERFKGMSLNEVHRAVGVGQLKFMVPYGLKLRGVEVSARFEGEPFYQAWEPVYENFPGLWDIVSNEKAGETITELRTPVGKLRLRHVILPEGIYTGTEPYLKDHLIQDEGDYRTVEYILERAEFIPLYDRLAEEQARLGDNAFVVPLLHRIPFQQVLLEYLGEIDLFYALHDTPQPIKRLLALLDGQMVDILHRLSEFNWPYVEFPDNLHGLMTNPRLFSEHCLPAYQRYTGILHAQGQKVGSHTDGDIRSLLSLLNESGLDVCESFSPAPLTRCTFEEAWEAFQGHPLIWGGIPSPILEESMSEADCMNYIQEVLNRIGNKPIILGVVDLFMRHNSIDRVQKIASMVENWAI
jgi:hypothetical protein